MGRETDCNKLHQALEIKPHYGLFSWSQKIENKLDINGIYLCSNGSNLLKLPSTKEKFESGYMGTSRPSNRSKKHYIFEPQQFNIKSDKVDGFKKSMEKLKVQVVQELFAVHLDHVILDDLEICLDKLVICYPGDSYCASFNRRKKPGTFGCMLLAIPIKNGGGGKIIATNIHHEVVFNVLDDGKCAKFHVTCMAAKRSEQGEQMYIVTPTGNGVFAFMVFSMVWLDAPLSNNQLYSDQFPFFILAVHQVNQVLASWYTPPEKKCEDSKISLPECLCIALRNTYNNTRFDYSKLVKEDWLVCRVLRALDYVSLSLAVIVFDQRKYPKNEGSHLTFEYWDSKSKTKSLDNSREIFRTSLDIEKQLLGDLGASLEQDENSHLMFQRSFNEDDFTSFHPGLVIEPKWSKANMACFSYQAVLRDITSRFPEAVEKMSRGNHSVRNLILSDINRLVKSANESESHWPVEECAKSFNVATLFSYCTQLSAVQEGLLILNAIADFRCPCRKHDWLVLYDEYEKNFAADVAQFVIHVSGWHAFSGVILRIITNWKSSRFFLQLAERLFNHRWLNEALSIVQASINQLAALTENELDNCPKGIVGQLIVLLNRLADAGTSDVNKVPKSTILQVFEKLPLQRLCDEIKMCSNHLKVKENNLLTDVLADLASNALIAKLQTITDGNFIYVIEVYTKSSQDEVSEHVWGIVLENFIRLSKTLKSGKAPTEKSDPLLVKAIMAIESYEEREIILKSLSNSNTACGIIDLLVGTFPFLMDHVQDKNRGDSDVIVSYFKRIFLFVSSAEKSPGLCNQTEQFRSSFSRLKIEILWKIVISVCCEEANHLKKFETSKETLRHLLSEILKHDAFEFVQSAGERFKEIFSAFLWLENKKLLDLFVKHIAPSQKSLNCQDVKSQFAFLIQLTSVLEIPGVYGESAKWKFLKLNRSNADLLMESWTRSALAIVQLEKPGNYELETKLEALAVQFFKSFAHSEKFLSQSEKSPFTQSFADVLDKLSTGTVLNFAAHLMDLEMNDSIPHLLKLTNCSILAKKVFLKLLTRTNFEETLVQVYSSSQSINGIKSFFWLGDEEILNILSQKLCSNPLHDGEFRFIIASIVTSQTVQILAKETPGGIKCLENLIDHLTNQTSRDLQPEYTWSFNDSSSKKEVDTFLKSDAERKSFGQYVTPKGAENFGYRNVQPSWNVRYEVVHEFTGKFSCLLIKTQQRIVEPVNKSLLEADLDRLTRLRNELKTPAKETRSSLKNRKRRFAELLKSTQKYK